MVRITKTLKVFLICLAVSILLITFGKISGDSGVFGNTIMLSIFILAAPVLLARYREFRELKEMEEKFPSFLRDLVESLRAGLPFHKAIISAKKITYGPLSKEVKKMANQLSWNVPLNKVLDQFSERIKSSKRIYVAVKIIREAYFSGGNVVSTLDSLVNSQIILVEAEKEKSSTLSQYVILMYAITIIFLFIVVALNRFMIPIFKISQQSEGFGLTNPCDSCAGLSCSVCGMYSSISSSLFQIEPTNIVAYYTPLFFLICIVQSIFSGLIAGEMSSGSVTAGIKHSLILFGIVFSMFNILVRIGLIGA